MNTLDTFLLFFKHPGYTGVGANILKHLKAEDQVKCMEVWKDVEEFILVNANVRREFIKKAQDECERGIYHRIATCCWRLYGEYDSESDIDEQEKARVLRFTREMIRERETSKVAMEQLIKWF